MQLNTSQLNSQQTEAVFHTDGPFLVLAGAGSGKTRIVTYRIARLLKENIPASSILALTFTNKAALEMNQRVQSLCQQNVKICTFHSLGAYILRESIHILGYQRDFTIYDEEDSLKLIRACMRSLNISEKTAQSKQLKRLISHFKNDAPSMEDYLGSFQSRELKKTFPVFYNLYQDSLKNYNALDFDDLLYLVVQLFSQHPEVLSLYQQQWKYLLIDEYQDTNISQYTIASLLVKNNNNIFAVGDPDQSIYSWRGANIHNILNFSKDFPGAKIVKLEQNYRSTSTILDTANSLIGHNYNRYEKKLWSSLGEGEKISFFVSPNENLEASFVVKEIKRIQNQNDTSLNDIVIFYRTNFQSRTFEDELLSQRVPYVIVGGVSFYQRKEIKDILAFLKIIQSESDFLAFVRTINLPKRGIGNSSLEKLKSIIDANKTPILSLCTQLLCPEKGQNLGIRLTKKHKEGLSSYINLIRSLRELRDRPLQDLVSETIEQTQYLDILRKDPETYDDRKANLDALIAKAAAKQEEDPEISLDTFLEELSLKGSSDEEQDSLEKVSLMTIHNGKGLEFNVTFLVGMEENLFPHINAQENPDAVEEERRLCYVGITRAKKQLYLTASRERFLWGRTQRMRPSRFLKELPAQNIQKVSFNEYETISSRPQKEYESQTHHKSSFKINDRVHHKHFGHGKVLETSQESIGLIYKILFSEDKKPKSIVAKYANLEKVIP